MKQTLRSLVIVVGLASAWAAGAAPKTLDIYFIDVEGGQSTLVVTPAGQTLLIDTGFPSTGGLRATAGDPHEARDANRIAAAARDAGVDRIDYLLITHFHADHVGGVVELAQLMPIDTFIDHGNVLPEAEQTVPGTLAAYNAYTPVRAKGKRIEPKPGDRLPLKGVEAIVVSSAGSVIRKPLVRTVGRNPACINSGIKAQHPNENPRSTGIRLRFGKFQFLDVGDLTGSPLHSLACPKNLIGRVDAYLIAHHGGADAADAATFGAFEPRIAIFNNGASKGGALATFIAAHQASGIEDVWQLHRSIPAGDKNFADDRIANLDQSTAHWIKVSANRDGSFRVFNGRTGVWTDYRAR